LLPNHEPGALKCTSQRFAFFGIAVILVTKPFYLHK
jgi:hypothetical protein